MNLHELFAADVRIVRDIVYVTDSDSRGHRLDVYSPPEANNLPVLVFFYGGGWRSGDKRLFEHLGRAFAVRGIVCVTVNYRLTPEVQHPDHVKDAAAAVAWVFRSISAYGGSANRLVIAGHSAGAHLAALVATNESYISEFDVPHSSVLAVIPISGLFDLRKATESSAYTAPEYVDRAFGTDPMHRALASPITHVRPGLPPFLVVTAENDPSILQRQAKEFSSALRTNGNEVRLVTVKGRDHFSIVRRFGINDDTCADIMVQYIEHHAKIQSQRDSI